VLSLAGGHMRRTLTEEEPYLYRHFGYREIGKEESGASTHELASCKLQQAPLELGLGHSIVVTRKGELAPSAVCTGKLPKGPVDRLN
jgi:hypothetical protein